MPSGLDDATEVAAGATACIEDALTRPRPEVRHGVPSVQGDHRIGGGIVCLCPEVVSFTDTRSRYALAQMCNLLLRRRRLHSPCPHGQSPLQKQGQPIIPLYSTIKRSNH